MPNIEFKCPVFFKEGQNIITDQGYEARIDFSFAQAPIQLGARLNDCEIHFLSKDEIMPSLKLGVSFYLWEAGYIGEGAISKIER